MSHLTIDHHEHRIRLFIGYLKDQKCSLDIRSITVHHIRGFLGHMRESRNLEQSTVQRYLVALKAFWRWCIQEGFTEDNPTATIKLGRPAQKVVKGLSPEQLKTLLNNLKDRKHEDARNKAIVLILVDCGLRVSELANLTIDDIDFERGLIQVMGKGSKQRLARMGLKTQKAVWKYLMMRGRTGSIWLWLNPMGEQLTANGVQQMIRNLGKDLGFRLYPHLLRHTFAISFLRNGANAFECQYSLGHSSLEMTRRYCQALSFEDVFRRHQMASPVDNAMKR